MTRKLSEAINILSLQNQIANESASKAVWDVVPIAEDIGFQFVST